MSLHVLAATRGSALLQVVVNAKSELYVRTVYEEGIIITDWAKLATATPPQWYALPFANGWKQDYSYNMNKYGKEQFGFVYVYIDAIIDTSISDSSWITISQLPQGFRPSTTMFTVGFDTAQNIPIAVQVDSGGNIIAKHLASSSWRTVKASIVFPAVPQDN